MADTYFVPDLKRFDEMFLKSDTVQAFRVGFYSGGCVDESDWLKDTLLQAKMLTCHPVIITQTFERDLQLSESYQIYASHGTIRYFSDDGFTVSKQYKVVSYNNKKVVININYYQPFEYFTTAKFSRVFH